MPRFIVINKRDKDEFDYHKTFGELKEAFGESLVPFSWPISTEIDDDLKEAITMTDDTLMEKYFEDDDFSEAEIRNGLKKGIQDGGIVPICSAAFELGKGSEGLMDLLVEYAPTPLEKGPCKSFKICEVHII